MPDNATIATLPDSQGHNHSEDVQLNQPQCDSTKPNDIRPSLLAPNATKPSATKPSQVQPSRVQSSQMRLSMSRLLPSKNRRLFLSACPEQGRRA